MKWKTAEELDREKRKAEAEEIKRRALEKRKENLPNDTDVLAEITMTLLQDNALLAELVMQNMMDLEELKNGGR